MKVQELVDLWESDPQKVTDYSVESLEVHEAMRLAVRITERFGANAGLLLCDNVEAWPE